VASCRTRPDAPLRWHPRRKQGLSTGLVSMSSSYGVSEHASVSGPMPEVVFSSTQDLTHEDLDMRCESDKGLQLRHSLAGSRIRDPTEPASVRRSARKEQTPYEATRQSVAWPRSRARSRMLTRQPRLVTVTRPPAFAGRVTCTTLHANVVEDSRVQLLEY